MSYQELMNEVALKFQEWTEDETMKDYFEEDPELLQKEFMECIQAAIGSHLVVKTRSEMTRELDEYHASMEGTGGWDDKPTFEYFDHQGYRKSLQRLKSK